MGMSKSIKRINFFAGCCELFFIWQVGNGYFADVVIHYSGP